MKPVILMTLGLAVSLAFIAPLKADNILANSDFSDGSANWKGDGKDASSVDMTDIGTSLDNSGAAKGMIVTLDPKRWKMISQTFETSEKALDFSMTYKTTSDFSEGAVPGGLGITMILQTMLKIPLQSNNGFGFPPNMQQRPGASSSALVAIADLDQNVVIYSPVSANLSTDSTTNSTRLNGLLEHAEKTLYVLFPPGSGSITFSSITLSPVAKPQQTDDDPFHH